MEYYAYVMVTRDSILPDTETKTTSPTELDGEKRE